MKIPKKSSTHSKLYSRFGSWWNFSLTTWNLDWTCGVCSFAGGALCTTVSTKLSKVNFDIRLRSISISHKINTLINFFYFIYLSIFTTSNIDRKSMTTTFCICIIIIERIVSFKRRHRVGDQYIVLISV